ncbi:Glu/Leu/Phe/Val family dehydrogenase [Sphingomonas sp. J315]|uniref:Glu/Leu/Phe/Val family dehydrogenase n=1 Tax=Sphingomonas sp. J315 TaxID=2898433 RepID=UPI0021AD6815|nr:Glu/Leu/Phe/Val dehydrogenase dimerization domain-containing protein [Sphingomonas sp. J315]UUX98086.1 NAD(P)-binding domain-containing protein [Sphingomonas sp. J315]
MPEFSAPVPPEEVLRLDDPQSGLSGVIVIHSTALGPAAGGCRFHRYASDADAVTDALRLAEGMSYKNALAGLPLGGGKAVVRMPDGPFDRTALFRAFGRAVASLGGRYVTAEDVGTSVSDMQCVADSTRHVAGLPARVGAAGGDPSPWTALGVLRSMEVAVQRHLGASLSDVTVAVQGLGHVGFALCEQLHDAGARLVVAEPRAEVAAEAARRFGASVVASEELVSAKAEVFAPCALGGVLDAVAVERIQAAVVCGAANNQLASPAQGDALLARGILYAPDYVVNAGGIINVAAEHLGWGVDEARARVEATGERLAAVLDHAAAERIAPHAAADRLARAAIARAPRQPGLAA